MAVFLGDDWIESLDDVVRSTPDLAHVADNPVVVEIRVVRARDEIVYHLTLGPGPARVRPGPAASPDLVMVATEDAAARIRSGDANAQSCLADGSLRLRGNPEVLIRRAAILATLGARFGDAVVTNPGG